MTALFVLLALLIGYLIGSLAPGWLYVRLKTGKDIRDVASGRTGGTNSYRAAGTAVGLATGASDILKGAVAVWVAVAVLQGFVSADSIPWLQIAAGVGAVTGHNYSLYLGFKGGAGTTPNIGWAMAIYWPVLPIGLLIGIVLFYLTGMASVVSLVIGTFLPIVFGIRYFMGFDPTPAYLIGSLITGALVVWALRPNITRIVEGTERVVGPRAKRLEQQRIRKTG